jgi:hypothetical protein
MHKVLDNTNMRKAKIIKNLIIEKLLDVSAMRAGAKIGE